MSTPNTQRESSSSGPKGDTTASPSPGQDSNSMSAEKRRITPTPVHPLEILPQSVFTLTSRSADQATKHTRTKSVRDFNTVSDTEDLPPLPASPETITLTVDDIIVTCNPEDARALTDCNNRILQQHQFNEAYRKAAVLLLLERRRKARAEGWVEGEHGEWRGPKGEEVDDFDEIEKGKGKGKEAAGK